MSLDCLELRFLIFICDFQAWLGTSILC